MNAMRSSKAWLTIFLLVVSLAWIWHARSMPWGSPVSPGPAVFPAAIGILVASLCLILLLTEGEKEKEAEVAHLVPSGEAGKRVVKIFLAIGAYPVLAGLLGHPVVAALVSLVILRSLGMRRWWATILLAIGFALGSHYLFAVLLDVPLPEGIWMPQ